MGVCVCELMWLVIVFGICLYVCARGRMVSECLYVSVSFCQDSEQSEASTIQELNIHEFKHSKIQIFKNSNIRETIAQRKTIAQERKKTSKVHTVNSSQGKDHNFESSHIRITWYSATALRPLMPDGILRPLHRSSSHQVLGACSAAPQLPSPLPSPFEASSLLLSSTVMK